MIRLTDPFQEIIDLLFYTFPVEPKPPIALRSYDTDEDPNNISINLAVAGFKEEDIKVYVDRNTLCIEGDNSKRDIPEKFKTSFIRKFPVKDQVQLEEASVSLVDGILSINIPVKKPEECRKYLFGNPKQLVTNVTKQ